MKDARDTFLLMLLERVGHLEDQLVALQKRAEEEDRRWPASSFELVKYERQWAVCTFLDPATWPTDTTRLCEGFFVALDRRCPARRARTSSRLVFCQHLHAFSTRHVLVVEGVVSSDTDTVTQEAIAASIEQAWGAHLLPPKSDLHCIEELITSRGLREAIHCVNGITRELVYDSGVGMRVEEGAAPRRSEVWERLCSRRSAYDTLKIVHPELHRRFPEMFLEATLPAGAVFTR